MSSFLGAYMENERVKQKRTREQLAKILGYKNINRGARRIAKLEREGSSHPDLFARIIAVLQIQPPTINELIAQDRKAMQEAFEAWVKVPIAREVIVRYIPSVYGTRKIPPDVTTDAEAEAFASSVAKALRRKVCLVLSRRFSVWFDETGAIVDRTEARPGRVNMPLMRVQGDPRPFLLGQ